MIKPDVCKINVLGLRSGVVPDSLKGEGRFGTAVWTAICSPWNVRGMGLIGGVVALHRGLEGDVLDPIIPQAPP